MKFNVGEVHVYYAPGIPDIFAHVDCLRDCTLVS